jgi:hypothetical protein
MTKQKWVEEEADPREVVRRRKERKVLIPGEVERLINCSSHRLHVQAVANTPIHSSTYISLRAGIKQSQRKQTGRGFP